MSETLHTVEGQSHPGPIDELRQAIDAFIDDNPQHVSDEELHGNLIAAVARVADKYGKTPAEMNVLIKTITLEES